MSPQPLEFGGTETFAAPPERVFNTLTDLDGLAALIPDLVSSERSGPDALNCVVRPGFSFLRGTLKLKIEVAELVPPQRATMRVAAQGIGVAIRIESNLGIEPVPEGSRLIWAARIVEMKGLVATLSPALVRAAADQVIRHAWQQVGEKVSRQ
ncbi:MAG TPA: SRPBCC domain-containing protein [Pirellulales bacterium]|jgi:carbon monoxide dehydrogenase subunit G|nr:SRPBCC domain-containing protein [Pirellulales bacterium]